MTPFSLRIVDKSHWIDKALVLPRALPPQGKAGPEPVQTGVYRLQGPRQDREGDMLYVGKSYPIRSLVASHYAELGLLKRSWRRSWCKCRLNPSGLLHAGDVLLTGDRAHFGAGCGKTLAGVLVYTPATKKISPQPC